MRKSLIIVAAAFAAFSVFGKGATQEWVRQQLSALRPSNSTNHIVTAAIPASWIDDEEGGTATGTITAEIGAHYALKVAASTVPEIPAGTFYARDAAGVYHNAQNALVPEIYATPYTVERTTTNALGVVSVKSVKMGHFWAVDSTGRAWRMGIDGDTILYCTEDRARYIVLRSTTLPERAASVLLPGASARLTVRGMLSLVFPAAVAATEEVVYTVNGETTVTVGQITFTRKNKFGKETVVTFTPEGLQGIYKGPTGPWNSKEEAQNALKNLDNWNFGDWDTIWNDLGVSRMTREEFENSDIWKQLVNLFETEKKEVIIETPEVPQHPCPAPADFWELDKEANDWKVNIKYRGATPYDFDGESLDAWRGANNCACGVVGCPNQNVPNHRIGRAYEKRGKLYTTDDADGGDGCKCCVRCVKYGKNPFATIDEFNDHRASGEGAGFCGCACGMYTTENEKDWNRDYHNRPKHTGGEDFSCMCYCAKAKAAGGGFIQHMKYAGDSPWCHNICRACGMVEDEEQYISHPWPAFDTRHVTLREAEWKDHTSRKEADDGANTVADPTYYQRCGCACGAYDENKTAGLPAEFAAFHQMKNSSCHCHCGQTHNKNRLGDKAVDPFPCPEICAVCFKAEDGESNAVFTFDGETYPKIVMIMPEGEEYHAAHGILCGCKCYNVPETRHEWSIGGDAVESVPAADGGGFPAFHVMNGSTCGCECGAVKKETIAPKYHHPGHEDLGPCWCKCATYHLGYSQKTKCRVCANCGKAENGDWPGDEDLHKLKEGATSDTGDRICRCECGYYSSEGVFTTAEGGTNAVWEATGRVPPAGGNLHAFDTSDGSKNSIGSLPCLCFCGGKHEARMATTYQKNTHGEKICDRVCTYCRERLKDGGKAKELDHDPRPTSDKHCGCQCGYYGIDPEHETAGREAQSVHLHIQSKGNAEGVAYCQCFGSGTGGKHHWHYKRTECKKICEYVRPEDKLGHLATESGHEIGITAAEPSAHTPKEHGCGCACGLCGNETKSLWVDEKALHKPAQNAANRCRCSCEKKHLVGNGEDGHEWPPLASAKACTCTCGEHHKNDWVNACGFCSLCKNIWRNGKRSDATIAANHLFTFSGCYCDGGCVVGGKKMLHPDGHIYPAKSCRCVCGETTLDHIVTTEAQKTGTYTCWDCFARFINYYITTKCARCGEVLEPGKGTSIGKHNEGCGQPDTGCWKCGCSCSGSHQRCGGGHYCSACCYKKPPTPPRPPIPDPDDPDPDNPEPPPEPPDPYETCNHTFTTEDWSGSEICGDCHQSFEFSGYCKYCTKCGYVKETKNKVTGKHTSPCTDDPGEPPTDPVTCQEELTDGGTCGTEYNAGGSCPNESNHKNHHGGNGGSGGGGLDDI